VSNLPEARSDIELEETQFRASVSESRATKIGSSINFINRRQFDTYIFALNGPYGKAQPAQGHDGMFTALYDLEIIGISFGHIVNGLSGTTDLDLVLFDVDKTNLGSVFTTRPSFNQNAGNNSFSTRNFLTVEDNLNTGFTLPVLANPDPQNNTLKVDKFQSLRFDTVANMQDAENAFIEIHFRPV
jgi:hypothetical protein